MALDQVVSNQFAALEAQVAALRATIPGQAPLQVSMSQFRAMLESLDVPDLPPPDPVPVPPDGVEIIHVVAGDDLQNIFDRITGPAIIRIQPGSTWRGNYTLRKKTLPADYWVVVRCDVDLPELGVLPWIQPSAAMLMPKFEAADADRPALTCEDGTERYHLLGLEFLPNRLRPENALGIFGRNETTRMIDFPRQFTFDRCYFHGHPQSGGRVGMYFNVIDGKVTGCYFEKFLYAGRDSQALCIISGPGPYLLERSYFEGSGENILIGGADPRIEGLVPSDIKVYGNHFKKPLEWKAQRGTVKNLFELKNARRVHVKGNLFENCWADAQSGHGIVFTIRNQDGFAPWSVIEDVTAEYNVILNCEGMGFNLLGEDYLHVSEKGKNLALKNNLLVNTNGVMTASGFEPTLIQRQTFLGLWTKFLQLTGGQSHGFSLVDSVMSYAQWGIAGEGTGLGVPSLDAFAPGYKMTHNVIERAVGVSYPPGNSLIPQGELQNRMSGYGYTGPETATDGGKVGADIEEIKRQMPWLLNAVDWPK